MTLTLVMRMRMIAKRIRIKDLTSTYMSPLFYEKVLITSFDEQLVQLFSVLHSVFKHQQPKIFSQKQRVRTKHTNYPSCTSKLWRWHKKCFDNGYQCSDSRP